MVTHVSRCQGGHDVVTPVAVLEQWSAFRRLGGVLTVLTGLGPWVVALHVVDDSVVRSGLISLEAVCSGHRHVAGVGQTGHNVHLDPHMGGVLGDVDILGVLDAGTVVGHSVVASQLDIIMAVRVVGDGQHVVVAVWTFVATAVNGDGDRHVGTGHDVGDTVEAEASIVVEVVVWDLLTDVLNTNTDFLRSHTLLVVSDGHHAWVVVWHVRVVLALRGWGRWCVSEDQADLTVLRAGWANLVDTVVVEVVDLPVVGVGRSVLDEVEHEVITDDGRGEVVRVDTLVRGFNRPGQVVQLVVNVSLDGGEVVGQVRHVLVIFHQGDGPWESRDRAVVCHHHGVRRAVPVHDDRSVVDWSDREDHVKRLSVLVLCTVVSESERDGTLATQLVVGVFSDGQFVVHDGDAEGRTVVRGAHVNSAGGPGVDLAGWSLLVGHVSDVRTACVRHIAQELGVRTESFWEDVVVAVVLREDWHTVDVHTVLVADIRSVVDVVHREGDVVGVAQTVAVRDLEGEHLRTELVDVGRDGHVLAVEHAVKQVVVVEGDLRSLSHGPGQGGLLVLHVISQVGKAERKGARVFVSAEVNQSVVRVRAFGVDDWTGTLDVNRALDVGRVAGSCHIAVVKDNVGSHGDVLHGSPVVGTGRWRLDHQVVVLLTGGRGAALVGLVDQDLRGQGTVSKVAVGQLDGHELGEVLQGCSTVQGLTWVSDADVSRGFLLDDSDDVDFVWHSTDAAPWDTELSE